MAGFNYSVDVSAFSDVWQKGKLHENCLTNEDWKFQRKHIAFDGNVAATKVAEVGSCYA